MVGNSASGVDLSSQLVTTCKEPVIVSEKSASSIPIEENASLKILPEIRAFEVEGRAVHFIDGHTETDVDAVIFCTGYFYTYPFLEGLSAPITQDGTYVQGLFEHLIYIDDPTLAFIGIPQRIVPFPIAEAQSAWIARVWANRVELPSASFMHDRESKRKDEGKVSHNLGYPKDVHYLNMFHEWSMKARKRPGLGNDGVGKIPPYWDSEAAWVREQFPLIKIASRKLGDKKHDVKTLADLGFIYSAQQGGVSTEEKLI